MALEALTVSLYSKKAALKVKYGTWNAQDITAVGHADIVIGTDIDGVASDKIQYGQGGNPALNAKTVTLADGTSVVVNSVGSGSFDKLDIKKLYC